MSAFGLAPRSSTSNVPRAAGSFEAAAMPPHAQRARYRHHVIPGAIPGGRGGKRMSDCVRTRGLVEANGAQQVPSGSAVVVGAVVVNALPVPSGRARLGRPEGKRDAVHA